jgi:hypothetical protein
MLTQFLGSVTFASLDAGALAITIDPSLLSPDEQKAFFYVYMASLGARIAVGVLTPAAESNIVKLENALATHASNLTQRQQQVMKALIQRLGGASKIVLESEYKEHFLAKLVYQARKNAQWRDKAGKLIEGDFRGNNYAVYEYIDLKGKVSYVVRASEGGGKHSEEICESFLKENNIPNKNVISIYTERSPCHIFKPDQIGKLPECGARIERDFPSAKVYYTFKYGNISPTTGKDISNDLHQAFMDALKSAP